VSINGEHQSFFTKVKTISLFPVDCFYLRITFRNILFSNHSEKSFLSGKIVLTIFLVICSAAILWQVHSVLNIIILHSQILQLEEGSNEDSQLPSHL